MTVVVSRGRTVDVDHQRPSSSWPLRGIEYQQDVYPRYGMLLDQLGYSQEYATIYRSQPWIWSLANKIARGISKLPLKSYRYTDMESGERERIRVHPLPILLSHPYPRGNLQRLVEYTMGSMCVFGNAIWWKYRPSSGRAPVELWPLDWRRIVLRTGENVPVEHWEYWASGGKMIMLPDDVVHFSWWSPDGPLGISPLEPLRVTLALEDANREYAVSSFSNAIRPSGALISERAMNDTALKELRRSIEAIHTGPRNAFRMLLLSGGLTWQQFSHTAEEAQTIEHRKLSQVEACAVYDIPPPLVAILDNATFSNITEQGKALYRDTFGAWLTMFEQTLDAQLLWGEPEFGQTFAEFDLGEILRSDFETRSQGYDRGRNVWTTNEMRKLENLPPIDDEAADTVWQPINFKPVGIDQPDPVVQPAPGDPIPAQQPAPPPGPPAQ